MDIIQKHTACFFGTMKHKIRRSGKVIYTARGVANSDLGLYANGRQVQRTGYRGIPGERLQGIEEYEHKAQTVGAPERVERLLKEFCKINGGGAV